MSLFCGSNKAECLDWMRSEPSCASEGEHQEWLIPLTHVPKVLLCRLPTLQGLNSSSSAEGVIIWVNLDGLEKMKGSAKLCHVCDISTRTQRVVFLTTSPWIIFWIPGLLQLWTNKTTKIGRQCSCNITMLFDQEVPHDRRTLGSFSGFSIFAIWSDAFR